MPRIPSSTLVANLEIQKQRLDQIKVRLDLDLDDTDHAAEIDAAIDGLEEALSDALNTLEEMDYEDEDDDEGSLDEGDDDEE